MPTAHTHDLPTVLQQLRDGQPTLWLNPALDRESQPLGPCAAMLDAEQRLARFAPLLAQLFPALSASNGLIESALRPAPALTQALLGDKTHAAPLLLKCDHELPVAGSVKARGGIHEVLCVAEQLAQEAGLLPADLDPTQISSADYLRLAEPQAQQHFRRYRIAVGSTGNLGLSIGIMAARLGFKVSVHMSRDARAWKKQCLRDAGADVIEHSGDYAAAVAEGRRQTEADPFGYFVDDENSQRLFYGYSVAALRLQQQLLQAKITVDDDHPLFVYLPCGVGGAPGGIAYGLKQLFGNNVHCFFAEPLQAPCMLYALASGQVASVGELGLNIDTAADGLAVGRASEPVADMMRERLSGIFTVHDDDLFRWVAQLNQREGINVEPSATAGFAGPALLSASESGRAYLRQQGLETKFAQARHILWTTGGSLVPEKEHARYVARGQQLITNHSLEA